MKCCRLAMRRTKKRKDESRYRMEKYQCFLPVPVGAIPTIFRAADGSEQDFDSKDRSNAGHRLSCTGVGFTEIDSLDDNTELFFLIFLFLRLCIRSSVPLTMCRPISITDGMLSLEMVHLGAFVLIAFTNSTDHDGW